MGAARAVRAAQTRVTQGVAGGVKLAATEGMKPVDLKDRLVADHRRLEQLFTQLNEAFAADDRESTQALWSQLDAGLDRHFEAEERYLFPRFQKLDATETAALRAEHAWLRERLDQLGAGVDLKLVKAEVAAGFLDALKAHARREDAILYRWAREALAGESGVIGDALTS